MELVRGMGIHPETVKVVVAHPLDRTGKAEERQTRMRACLRPPGGAGGVYKYTALG